MPYSNNTTPIRLKSSSLPNTYTPIITLPTTSYVPFAFGQTTSWVADERQSLSIALEFPQDERIQLIIERFMSKALVTLFKDLQCLTHSHFSPREPTLLTHNDILAAVDKAITSLPT